MALAILKSERGNSLAVQWWGFRPLTFTGSIPGQGTEFPQARWLLPNKYSHTESALKGHDQEAPTVSSDGGPGFWTVPRIDCLASGWPSQSTAPALCCRVPACGCVTAPQLSLTPLTHSPLRTLSASTHTSGDQSPSSSAMTQMFSPDWSVLLLLP